MEKYLSKNNRDINKDEPTESAKGYLGPFTESAIMEGCIHKSLDVQFGKPEKINPEMEEVNSDDSEDMPSEKMTSSGY